MAWRKYVGVFAGFAVSVLLISAIKTYSFQSQPGALAANVETSNFALARASAEASMSLEQARANERQVKNLKHALYGSTASRSPPALVKAAQVKQPMQQQSTDSEIEAEARAAGARALTDRRPIPLRKQILQAQPTVAPLPVMKNITVENPMGYLHKDDRYANTGVVLDRNYFASKYGTPSAESPEPAKAANTKEANETAASVKVAREQQLADSSWSLEDGSASSSSQQSEMGTKLAKLNDPDAPLPEGGVPVPGGHIIWVAENSLKPNIRHEQQAVPSADSHSKQPKATVKSQTNPVHSNQALNTQLTVGENINLPLPLMDYSKVVAYGPDGKPELMWYRPGSAAPAQPAPFNGYADSHLSSGPEGHRYSVLTTGQSNSEGPHSAKLTAGSEARRGRRAAAALSAEDRRIERDLLYRLLDKPSGGVQERFIKPSRVQELAESGAQRATTGSLALTLLCGILVLLVPQHRLW